MSTRLKTSNYSLLVQLKGEVDERWSLWSNYIGIGRGLFSIERFMNDLLNKKNSSLLYGTRNPVKVGEIFSGRDFCQKVLDWINEIPDYAKFLYDTSMLAETLVILCGIKDDYLFMIVKSDD